MFGWPWQMSYKGYKWMRGHDIIPRDWFRPSWGWFRWSAIISKAIRLDPILVKNHLFCFIKGQWAKSSDGAENLFPDLPPYEWNDRIQKSIKNSKLTSLFFVTPPFPKSIPAKWWWSQCSGGRVKCHIKVSYECGDMISSLEIGFDPVGGDSDCQRSFPRPLDLTRFW